MGVIKGIVKKGIEIIGGKAVLPTIGRSQSVSNSYINIVLEMCVTAVILKVSGVS